MAGHVYLEGERCPRALGLMRHVLACQGDINAALNAMQGVERAGQPLQHLKLQEQHFRDAAHFLEQSGHADWAAKVNAHADEMYQHKPRGR